MKERPSTILLSGEASRQFEGLAADAITPGMLLSIQGANATDGMYTVPGRAKNVGPHDVAGGPGDMFACEFTPTGRSIEDDYATGETVIYLSARKGDRVFALLAAGDDVSAGDLLQSNGDGSLTALVAGDGGADPVTFGGTAIAVALEDIDNDPGTGGAAVRIKVEVL